MMSFDIISIVMGFDMSDILKILLIFLGIIGVEIILLLAFVSFIIWRSYMDMESFKDE